MFEGVPRITFAEFASFETYAVQGKAYAAYGARACLIEFYLNAVFLQFCRKFLKGHRLLQGVADIFLQKHTNGGFLLSDSLFQFAFFRRRPFGFSAVFHLHKPKFFFQLAHDSFLPFIIMGIADNRTVKAYAV